jgi:hypothetical protein
MGSANGVVRFNFPHSMLLGYATGSSDGVPDCDGSGLPDAVTISALHVNDAGAVHGLLVDRVPSDAESAARETYCSSVPCPADRDHLTLLAMFGASELVTVRYAISYRGSAGIDGNLAPRATPEPERRGHRRSVGIDGPSAPGATPELDTNKNEHRSAPGATPEPERRGRRRSAGIDGRSAPGATPGEESLSGRSAPGATPEPERRGGGRSVGIDGRSAPGATPVISADHRSAPGATLGEESLSGRSVGIAGIDGQSAPGATLGPDKDEYTRSAPGATPGEESFSGRSVGIAGLDTDGNERRSAPGATPRPLAKTWTSASTGTVYVHAYSDPGSGRPDNSRLVAVLAGPGSTWTSTTTNLTVTVVSGNASSVALRVCAPDAPHDGVATSAGAVLGAWSIAFISIGAALLVSVACLASSDSFPGLSSRTEYVRLRGSAEPGTRESVRLDPGDGVM